MTGTSINSASFKDPAGFVFQHNGKIYRQVNVSYAKNYDQLMGSGLYEQLTHKNWLLPHTESNESIAPSPGVYKILLPEQVAFISYSYEWSFDMLKDAALLTLKINRAAIESGMILKDATPYNIQFNKGKPVFIDTLSFENYDELKPWIAYRQFCEMFLFPLYLEYYLDSSIRKILSNYIDGIPVNLVAKLLPFRSRLNFNVWLHVHVQNFIKGNKDGQETNLKFNKNKLVRLLDSLQTSVEALTLNRLVRSTWSNYYDETILSQEYLEAKEKIVRAFVNEMSFETALDVGANDGYFTRILAEKASEVIAVDFDSQCINRLYLDTRKEKARNILPLVGDITNPSPAIGFNNEERESLLDRLRPDLVLALALIHHIVISKNIPLNLLAKFFRKIAPLLIIEFIPREDVKVQQMIGNRTTVFAEYTREYFEDEMFRHFELVKREEIPGSCRTLYLLQRK